MRCLVEEAEVGHELGQVLVEDGPVRQRGVPQRLVAIGRRRRIARRANRVQLVARDALEEEKRGKKKEKKERFVRTILKPLQPLRFREWLILFLTPLFYFFGRLDLEGQELDVVRGGGALLAAARNQVKPLLQERQDQWAKSLRSPDARAAPALP